MYDIFVNILSNVIIVHVHKTNTSIFSNILHITFTIITKYIYVLP